MKETSYNLGKIELVSLENGRQIDIRELVEGLVIYETLLDGPYLSGNLIVHDGIGLLEGFPVKGNEVVRIRFRTGSRADWFDVRFRVRDVVGMVQRTSKVRAYTLKLISEGFWVNTQSIVRRTYRGKPHEIVNDVLSGMDFKLWESIETVNQVEIAVPSLHPFQFINRLSVMAQGKRGEFSFIFFENSMGYSFSSIDGLIETRPKHNLTNKIRNTGKSDVDPNNVFREMMTSGFDFLENANLGVYGHRVGTYTLNGRRYTETVFGVDEIANKARLLGKNPLVKSDGNVNRQAVFSGDVHGEWLSSGFSYRSVRLGLLKNFVTEVEIGSNTSIHVGDVVVFDKQTTVLGERGSDRLNSGQYMVTKIKHSLTLDSHVMGLELAKDSVG